MISVLKMYLKVAWACKTPFILPLDMKYKLLSRDEFLNIGVALAEEFKYLTDIADCDDAAWRFKGEASRRKENGVGFVIGLMGRVLHTWNVAITEDGVFQVEPQDNVLVTKYKSRYWSILVII